MNIFNKVWKYKRYLRNIIQSIYFNFHYLPFNQAIKIPILLYKPRFLELHGNIKINGNIKCGMIKLGFTGVSLYPNSGVTIENHGGTIIFNGSCFIGNNSYKLVIKVVLNLEIDLLQQQHFELLHTIILYSENVLALDGIH